MTKEELYNVLKIKDNMIDELVKKLDNKENIIKEVRKLLEPYVEFGDSITLKGSMLKPIYEILDKVDKE